MSRKRKVFAFMILLGIVLLLQYLTTSFHSLGWHWQILLPALTMTLMGLPFAFYLSREIFDAIMALGWIGLFIPGMLASTLLIGPFNLSLGALPGLLIALLVSLFGSVSFWVVALTPAVLEHLANAAEGFQNALGAAIGPDVIGGLIARARPDQLTESGRFHEQTGRRGKEWLN